MGKFHFHFSLNVRDAGKLGASLTAFSPPPPPKKKRSTLDLYRYVLQYCITAHVAQQPLSWRWAVKCMTTRKEKQHQRMMKHQGGERQRERDRERERGEGRFSSTMSIALPTSIISNNLILTEHVVHANRVQTCSNSCGIVWQSLIKPSHRIYRELQGRNLDHNEY